MINNFLKRTLVTFRRGSIKFLLDNSNIRKINCGVCVRNSRHPPKNGASPAISSKYVVITETNNPVIQNTAEEIYRDNKYPIFSDEFDGINLKRGQTGVFEIEDLIELLHRENSKDIFVATVPSGINYVDYICIVSAHSKRHIRALAEFVKKVYKKKCHQKDPIPRIEGKDSDEWIALDLGNIALHIFSNKVRQTYDLETLWAVGPEYDEQIHKKSEATEMFETYSSYLKDLKPLA